MYPINEQPILSEVCEVFSLKSKKILHVQSNMMLNEDFAPQGVSCFKLNKSVLPYLPDDLIFVFDDTTLVQAMTKNKAFPVGEIDSEYLDYRNFVDLKKTMYLNKIMTNIIHIKFIFDEPVCLTKVYFTPTSKLQNIRDKIGPSFAVSYAVSYAIK